MIKTDGGFITQSQKLRYLIVAMPVWFIVDFGTAGGFRVSYLAMNPHIILFCFTYPLLFAYLIFSRNWSGQKLFGATFAAMFFIEGALTRNPFVLAFPLLIIGIPLAMCIYSLLTFFPLWTVNGELKERWRIVILLSIVVVVVMILSAFGGHRQ